MSGKEKRRINVPALFATCLYIGKIPVMPGTLGALLVYPVYLLILCMSNDVDVVVSALSYIIALIIVPSLWSISDYSNAINQQDHRSIIIDEFIGQSIALMFAIHYIAQMELFTCTHFYCQSEHVAFFVSFVLFRYFDIAKPLGIRWLERKVQNSIGVIIDDIVAALYSGAVMITFYWVYGFISTYI